MLSSILKNGAAKEVSNKANVTFYEKYVYNMDVLLLKTGYKMRISTLSIASQKGYVSRTNWSYEGWQMKSYILLPNSTLQQY